MHFCQILSDFVRFCQILSHFVTFRHILSHFVTFWHIWYILAGCGKNWYIWPLLCRMALCQKISSKSIWRLSPNPSFSPISAMVDCLPAATLAYYDPCPLRPIPHYSKPIETPMLFDAICQILSDFASFCQILSDFGRFWHIWYIWAGCGKNWSIWPHSCR